MALNIPKPFNPSKNQKAKDWQIWKQEFVTYLRLSGGYEKLTEENRALLLQNLMGPISFEVMENMVFETPSDRNDMDILLAKFDEIFDPPKKEVESRYKFFSRMLDANELIETYIADLKIRAKMCNFGPLTERFVIDQIIRNLDSYLQQMIFKQENITLDNIIESYKQNKINTEKIKELSESMANVPDSSRGREQAKRVCIKCGTNHAFGQCPAFHEKCPKCNNVGHFESQCGKVHALKNKTNKQSTESSRPYKSTSIPPTYDEVTQKITTNKQTSDKLTSKSKMTAENSPNASSYCYSCKNNPEVFCFDCKQKNINRTSRQVPQEFVKVEKTDVPKFFPQAQSRESASSLPKHNSNTSSTSKTNAKKKDDCCIS